MKKKNKEEENRDRKKGCRVLTQGTWSGTIGGGKRERLYRSHNREKVKRDTITSIHSVDGQMLDRSIELKRLGKQVLGARQHEFVSLFDRHFRYTRNITDFLLRLLLLRCLPVGENGGSFGRSQEKLQLSIVSVLAIVYLFVSIACVRLPRAE